MVSVTKTARALLVVAVVCIVVAVGLLAYAGNPAETFADNDAAGYVVYLGMACAGIAAGLAWTVLWVLMLVDAIRRSDGAYPGSGGGKTLWIVLLVLLPLSAIFYYFRVLKPSGPAVGRSPSDTRAP